MISTQPRPGHSADVRIELFIDGHSFPVAQMGRGFLMFDEPLTLPATSGEIVLTIDGNRRRWSVSFQTSATPAKIFHPSFAEIS